MKFLKYIGLIAFVVACVEQPSDCIIKKPTSAAFTVSENIQGEDAAFYNWIPYYSDTFLAGLQLTLRAVQPTAVGTNFKWNIGLGIYTTSSVVLRFSGSGVKRFQPIPIKLEVNNKNTDRVCFPADSGQETVVKSIVPVYAEDIVLNGHWFGTWNNNTEDTASIFIDASHKNTFDSLRIGGLGFYTKGLLRNGCETFQYGEALGYKQAFFSQIKGAGGVTVPECNCSGKEPCYGNPVLMRITDDNNSIEIKAVSQITNNINIYKGKRKSN